MTTASGPAVAGTRLRMGAKLVSGSATVARFMFANPVGLSVAAAAWAASECVEYQDGKWRLTCGAGTPTVSDGYQYRWGAYSTFGPWVSTVKEACEGAMAKYKSMSDPSLVTWELLSWQYGTGGSQNTWCEWQAKRANGTVGYGPAKVQALLRQTATGCPAGWYITESGCSAVATMPEMTQEEMATKLASKNLPSLSGVDWTGWGDPSFRVPGSSVVLNPTSGPNPAPQPLVIPVGNPQKVPNSDPVRFQQPIVTVTPSPTANDPLRVDVVPGTREGDSATGLQSPEEVGEPPAGDTPKEEQQTQCDKYPDTLGCAELDVPDGEIPTDEVQLSYTAETPFGGGSCPADKFMTVSLTGQSVKAWDWAQTCSLTATYVRPLIILLATITAFFIVALGRDEQ